MDWNERWFLHLRVCKNWLYCQVSFQRLVQFFGSSHSTFTDISLQPCNLRRFFLLDRRMLLSPLAATRDVVRFCIPCLSLKPFRQHPQAHVCRHMPVWNHILFRRLFQVLRNLCNCTSPLLASWHYVSRHCRSRVRDQELFDWSLICLHPCIRSCTRMHLQIVGCSPYSQNSQTTGRHDDKSTQNNEGRILVHRRPDHSGKWTNPNP